MASYVHMYICTCMYMSLYMQVHMGGMDGTDVHMCAHAREGQMTTPGVIPQLSCSYFGDRVSHQPGTQRD